MPSVTITLTDTPTGGVAIHTDFKPAIGAPCSPAQAAVLDIISRTKRDWGMKAPLLAEVDIDAVHRTRDRVVPSTNIKIHQTTGHTDAIPASESGDRRFWPIEEGK